MKETRKPQMDLKTTCAVGGKPGALFVSPDGTQLFVFDQERPRVTVVSVASFQVLEQVELPLPNAGPRYCLAGLEDSIFLGGLPGKIGVFSASSRRFSGAIPCDGEVCDVALLPELSQAVVTTVSGAQGAVEILGLRPIASLARLELPLAPVRETLALLPGHGLGAVVLRDADHRDAAIAIFECRSGSEAWFLKLESGVRSVAFEPDGRFLYAASHDDSMLTVVDLREQRVVDRVLLAGEPFEVVSDPLGRRLWTLCEKLGHVAFVDPRDQMVIHRTQLPGLLPGRRGVAFSPEGRLAVIPQLGDGCLALIEGGEPGAQYGELDDLLELGREVGEVVWSPLGEEIYVTSPRAGELLRLTVDRGDQLMKDTDLYLMDQLLRQEDPAGWKNPLFPP